MQIPELPPSLAQIPYLPAMVGLAGLALAAWIASLITRRVALRVLGRITRTSASRWDDALMARGVLSRLSHVVPALVVYVGILAVPALTEEVELVVRSVAAAYMVLTVALAAANLLTVLNDIYEFDDKRARERPIKGYLQVFRLVIFVIAAVLMIATLINRSPLLLLSGFGAMTAVLMLVFKDTILSLVASVQLSSNDMLRVGDWIEMPSLQADGDVIDVALHTVKVQNWDKTITTVPTHRLITESFRNWRGMEDSGGRRIKRALHIDQSSVRFLSAAERDRLRRIALIDEYLNRKRLELEEYNSTLIAAGKDPVNTRRVTNLGTFRVYVEEYLRSHRGINQDMTLMVRQLPPGPTGLPLELYCFTASTEWVPHENTQSDIFDHLLAMLPEFGLRVFQQPGGGDIAAALERQRVAV